MGISGLQLLAILVIVVLIFGTKKFRDIGGDLGGGIKSFKKAMKEGEEAAKDSLNDSAQRTDANLVDAKVEDTTDSKPKP